MTPFNSLYRPGDSLRTLTNQPTPFNRVDKAKMDSEYSALMAELGEGPPSGGNDMRPAGGHQGKQNSGPGQPPFNRQPFSNPPPRVPPPHQMVRFFFDKVIHYNYICCNLVDIVCSLKFLEHETNLDNAQSCFRRG